MRNIRNKRLAALLAALVVGLGGAFASPASSEVEVAAPTIDIACKRAKIGGKRKCIAAGQFCSRKYERDYNRYGYTCSKKDKNGRYHLQKL